MQGLVCADSAGIAARIRRLDRDLLDWDVLRGLRWMVERGKWSSPHSPELEVDSKSASRRGPRSSCVGKFKSSSVFTEVRGPYRFYYSSTATSATATSDYIPSSRFYHMYSTEGTLCLYNWPPQLYDHSSLQLIR